MKIATILLFILITCHTAWSAPLKNTQEEKLSNIITSIKNGTEKDATGKLYLIESELTKFPKTPESAGLYLLLGRAYFYAELDSKATTSLKTALKYDSKLSDAHFFLGLINHFANNLSMAEHEFKTAINLDQSQSKYFVELGRVLKAQNDYDNALSAFSKALNIDNTNFKANLYSANIHFSKGNTKQAEKFYISSLKADQNNSNANYNLGQLYQNNKQHQLALKYYSKVVETNKTDWKALSKIIQENQALKDFKNRDYAIQQIYNLWNLKRAKELNEQGFYIREQLSLNTNKLFVMDYFELTGERAVKYVFIIQNIHTGKHKYKISLGSYDATTQLSRELGDIGPRDRVFHLDRYNTDGGHYTYAFWKSEPNYSTVRELVLKVISGELKEISSSTPTAR